MNWRPNPVLDTIADDDPDILKIVVSIGKPVMPMQEVIAAAPHEKTTAYGHAESFSEEKPETTGLLETWISQGRRFAFSHDFAKYLIALRRLGEQQAPTVQQKTLRKSAATRRPALSDDGGAAPLSTSPLK